MALAAISKKPVRFKWQDSGLTSNIKYVIVLKSVVREIFSTTKCRIIAVGAPKRQLPFILLPAKTTFCVPQKDTTAFAYPSGKSPLPFNDTAVFIGSREKYPDPLILTNPTIVEIK